MPWLDRYMAVPFKDRGRGFDGCDCAGLYALIVAHEAGWSIPVPDCGAASDPAHAIAMVGAEIAAGRWRKIEGAPKQVAQKFDAVLMSGVVVSNGTARRADIHIGCATGDGRLIHIEAGRGPRYLPLDDPDIRRRITRPVHGIYRPAFLEKS